MEIEAKNFIVRKAGPDDANDLRFLIQELADFEKMPNGPEISAQQLSSDLANNIVQSFIVYHTAEGNVEGEVAAMTLFYNAYSTWQGQYIHMEDLYFRQKFRRCGLAKRLVREIANLAIERGVKRINWTVLDWNVGARDFYKQIGGVNLTEANGWLIYRLNEEQIKAFVKSI